MLINNREIHQRHQDGEIVMVPFSPEQIQTCSVDVSLGRWAFTMDESRWVRVLRLLARHRADGLIALITTVLSAFARAPALDVLNPDVQWVKHDLADAPITIPVGGRILVHTHEFIGARRRTLPEMRAKSSSARWGFTVCACAGWGDVGFFNRWAMEVYNFNARPLTLTMGTLVAQIVFHDVEAPAADTLYHKGETAYQRTDVVEVMTREWRPEDILPKPLKLAAWAKP